ncbi:MAG TPA: DNA-binding protein [Lachnoclostridium sp.]|nr:DNA-binding protein [Lachnoclostridium sp.]
MKPSCFQKTIENQFDYIGKRAMEDERKDYQRYISRLSKHEISFSDMGDYLVSQFSTVDNYATDFHTFTLNGSTIGVENDLLSEALKSLTEKKREIILLYYFMDMNDTEIAEILKLNRSTVYRHRTSGLAFIKEFMEEHTE